MGMMRTRPRAILVGAASTLFAAIVACGVSVKHAAQSPDGGAPDASSSSSPASPEAGDGTNGADRLAPDSPVANDGGLDACEMGLNGALDDTRVTDAQIGVAYTDAGAVTCYPSAEPAVCAGSCGNNIRDTCSTGMTGGGSISVQEECDGLDLGGITCASLGFAGGTLACGSTCHFDTSACETCPATGDPDGGCSPLSPPVWGVGLGASANELGFAWVEHDATCGGVRFDRYAPDLSRISESECLGSCDAYSVAVAPTSTGWLLAINGTHGLDLVPLDGQGHVSGSIRTLAAVFWATLAPRSLAGSADERQEVVPARHQETLRRVRISIRACGPRVWSGGLPFRSVRDSRRRL